MSIARLADTITLRTEGGTVYERVTRMSAEKVCMNDKVFTAAEALEVALALVTAATGTIVQRSLTEHAYDIQTGHARVTLNPLATGEMRDHDAAWAVADLVSMLGPSAFAGLAGESTEKLAHRFSYLTDEQAQEISSYFAALVP